MTWRNVIAAGAVVGLSGAALAAGTVWQADTRTAVAADDATPAVKEFLRSARLTCPQVVGSGADVLVSAASVPGFGGQDVPGKAAITSGDKGQAAQGTQSIDQPGATARLTSASKPSTPVIDAAGGLAPGLVTARLTDDHSGEGKGLASSPCLEPASESWLIGGTAGPGQRDTLSLINPTGTDSQVDVSAFAKGGALDITGQEDIVVPAGESRTIKLSAIAPHIDQLAVRVHTKVGLIAAEITDDRMEGLTPMGTDIITTAGEPQRTVTLAAVPSGPGAREVQILPPQDSGSVHLTALTPDGELPLLAGQAIPVTKEHLAVLDLTKDLGGRAAAIRIDGDVPVVAGVSAATAVDASIRSKRAAKVAAAEEALKNATGEAERRDAETVLSQAETANAIDPGEDLAWFGPAQPVTNAAVASLRSDLDTELLVTGTGGDATVTVGVLPAAGDHATRHPYRRVVIPANTTVEVPLEPPSGPSSYTAVVTRVSGPGRVHVSHIQGDGRKTITGYAVGPIPIWVPLPSVAPVYSQR